MDVSDVSSIERAFDQAEEAMGGEPIDVLINNAGIATPNIALRITPDEWDSLMDTNLRYAHPLPFPTLPYPSVSVCIWLGYLYPLNCVHRGAFFVAQQAATRLVKVSPRQKERRVHHLADARCAAVHAHSRVNVTACACSKAKRAASSTSHPSWDNGRTSTYVVYQYFQYISLLPHTLY